MAFALGHIVRDIVNDAQSHVVAKNSAERSAREMGDHLAVGPGEIRGSRHRPKIALSFG